MVCFCDLVEFSTVVEMLSHVAGQGISTRHGEICLNCGGPRLAVGLKSLNPLTGSRFTGKHICKSMHFFFGYFFLISDRKWVGKFRSWSICFFLFSEISKNSCLDEVVEVASLPSFDGCLGEVKISGTNC